MDNKVHVIGDVVGSLELSHKTGNEQFYSFFISIKRSSGVEDTLNVIVSERSLFGVQLNSGDTVEITGQYRSFNKFDGDGKRKVQLFIFVKSMEVVPTGTEHVNEVELIGNIAKCYRCRHTKTQRHVIDFIFKVSRDYNRYDYLTCIAWGRNAMFIEKLCGQFGKSEEQMEVKGRLQSRNFITKDEDGNDITKVMYELSTSSIEIIGNTPEIEKELDITDVEDEISPEM